MAQELMMAFIDQMIVSLDGIGEALRILQLHCQKLEDGEAPVKSSEQKSDTELEKLRELMGQKAKDGKSDRIRELLSLFHAERLSDVHREDYPRLLEMVQKL